MTIRTTILTPPSMREAYAAILALEAEYLKAHKRKTAIELTMASTSKPMYDERGRAKLSTEIVEVRAVYDNGSAAQISEYEWLAARAQETLTTCY